MSTDERTVDFHLDKLDLNLLRVFLVLMQQRSVTKASQHLDRPQPAVSHSLAKLREFFHDDLFSRDSSAMEPTARARELAAVIESSLAEINDAVDRHLHFDAATTKRNFRIGVTDDAALAYIPGLTRRFASQAPNAALNVVHAPASQVSSLIRSSDIDYAIVPAHGIADPRLELIPLSRDRLLCIGWRGNALMHKPMTIEDYLTALHLQVSADGVSPGVANRMLQAQRLKRRVVATVPYYLVAPSILKGSNLLAILGDSILFALNDDNEMMVSSPPIKLPRLNVCLAYDPTRQHDDGHKWLRQLIVDLWKEQRLRKRKLMARYSRGGMN
ncbi:MAG: Transcriptional regulator, LysR family [uncultured Paraburkholderia sp.]|nr:MAG: Transcriptional regulator, LysR family [uncultured Paraburkholderia sp.]